MTINQLRKRVSNSKELTIDQRIEFEEEIVKLSDEIEEVKEMIQNLPDAEPEKGVADPRMAFIEELMEESQTVTVKETVTKASTK